MRKRPFLLALLLASCTPREYVSADRLTYEAVAPAHAAYVQADPQLTPDQKQARLDLLQSWRFRVEAAEARR